MSGPSQIQYLVREQVDATRWDQCIRGADNGLIYGYSFYLDHMADNWDALVWGDYEAVMPLPWKKKYGIYYLTQPFLTAQLGVFGSMITPGILEDFLNAIPSRFRYWDLYLNHGNVFSLPGYNLYERTNFVLNLDRAYDELAAGYRDTTRRNIKKALQLGCTVQKDPDLEKVIMLAAGQMRSQNQESAEHIERFRKLYTYLYPKQMAATYGILSGKKELIASCVFFFSHHRAYYILVGNHPDGKTIGASHALIDAFIQENAGKKLILDFEGSDIRNLAFFYSSFGAGEEKYAGVKVNRLPVYLKWMKKS